MGAGALSGTGGRDQTRCMYSLSCPSCSQQSTVTPVHLFLKHGCVCAAFFMDDLLKTTKTSCAYEMQLVQSSVPIVILFNP